MQQIPSNPIVKTPLWHGELRRMTTLAIPVVLSEIGWMAMTIVDTIMVGRLGPEAIGAVALGNAIYYAPSICGIGLLLGLDTLVSQAYGRKDYDECHRWMAQALYIAMAATPVLMLIVWLASHSFTALGINPVEIGPAHSYLLILNLGTLPLFFYGGARRYLQGVGRVKPITLTYIFANLVNLAGNWALIYGHLGLPRLGVPGSAISTVLARIVMAAMLMGFAWHHERSRGHPLFAHWPGPNWSRIRELLGLGLPVAIAILVEVGAFGAATLLAGQLAPEALAAHQIALNCVSLTYMVPLGVSAAAAVSVGHAVGAGDWNRARRAGWLALLLGGGFMVCAAIVLLVWPVSLIRIYTQDPRVLAIGPGLLALGGAFQIFDGIQATLTGALRGLGETRVPMYANLGSYWLLGLPLGAALCFWRGWGIYGVWVGLTTALILVALLVLSRWVWDSRRLGSKRFHANAN